MRPSIAIDPIERAEPAKASAVGEFFRRYRRAIDDWLEIASIGFGVAATRELLTALIGTPSGAS